MNSRVTRNLADIKPGTLFAGIDLGLDTHMVVVIDEGARQQAQFRITNDAFGFQRLFRRLEQLRLRHQAPAVLVAMEPTGHLWKPLAQALDAQGVRYVLVNAFTVHRQREGDNLDRAKDDPRDARAIAFLARNGTFTETRLLEGDYAQLRHLSTRLETITVEVTRLKNRLRADIATCFPEFTIAFQDVTGLTAQAILLDGLDPTRIAELPFNVWVAQVRRLFRGQRLALSQMRRLQELAATTVGYRPIREAAQLTIRQTLQSLLGFLTQQEELREALRHTVRHVPGVEWALTLPGLGALSLARILGHIGDPATYRHAKQLVKLAGIHPVPNTSGRCTHRRTCMAGQGRAGLRTVLYYTCLHVLQADPAFRRAYERLLQRPGAALTKMQAIVALMNKLIRVIWTLLRHQLPYDPQRAFAA